MKEYRKYHIQGIDIVDGGTQFMSEQETYQHGADTAIIELDKEPNSLELLTIENGKLIPAPTEIVLQRSKNRTATLIAKEIGELEKYLKDTDWAVIKCTEQGATIAELHPEIHALRTTKRQKLSELTDSQK